MSIFNSYKEISDIKNFDADSHEIEEIEEESKRLFKPFVNPFFGFGIIVFVVLGLRLADLQIIKGSQNLFAAQGNFIRKRVIPASRGLILDRNGVFLLKNSASLNLVVYPNELPSKKSERLSLYEKLIENFQVSREVFQKIEENQFKNFDPVTLKENLTQEDAVKIQVEIANYQGVAVVQNPSREYISEANLAHIIGYTSKISEDELNNDKEEKYRLDSIVGRTGIEAIYENYLKGEDGFSIVEVDSKGKVVQTKPGQGPKIGHTVNLTLDFDLQKKVSEIIKQYTLDTGNNKVASIVMNSQTGAIDAMVSTPCYDNNFFVKPIKSDEYKKLLDDPLLPLLNRVIAGSYPSGSTIKPVMAVAALNEGIIDKNTVLVTPPAIQIGQWIFPDNKPHGSANVRKAIAESNNVFFYIVGGGYQNINGLGSEKMEQYFRKFGLGSKTGIDLPGEAKGFIPNPKYKQEKFNERWYIGDTYHLSIGQAGLLVSPLQMARATSIIANNGKNIIPHLLSSIDNQDKSDLFKSSNDLIVPEQHLSTVREGMRQAVTDGSSRSLKDLPVQVAGKTGTAQFGTEDKTHAWYISFAPYEDPRYTVVVFVEGGGEGWDQAAPIAKQIYQYLYSR